MRQALTVTLQDFSGAIVLISHDRHLLTNTVDMFLLVECGQVEPFAGDLDDYRTRLLNRNKDTTASSPRLDAPILPAKKNFRASQQLNTKIKTLESRLERLNRKLAEVEASLGDVTLYQQTDSDDLQGLLREQISLKEQVELIEEEWLKLGEELESNA
jgi:ATP-binding cassette subfamily F protein 3